MTMQPAFVEGCYPSNPGPIQSKNMTVSITESLGGHVQLRIDDWMNPEFWMQITMGKTDLERLLRRINKSKS